MLLAGNHSSLWPRLLLLLEAGRVNQILARLTALSRDNISAILLVLIRYVIRYRRLWASLVLMLLIQLQIQELLVLVLGLGDHLDGGRL